MTTNFNVSEFKAHLLGNNQKLTIKTFVGADGKYPLVWAGKTEGEVGKPRPSYMVTLTTKTETKNAEGKTEAKTETFRFVVVASPNGNVTLCLWDEKARGKDSKILASQIKYDKKESGGDITYSNLYVIPNMAVFAKAQNILAHIFGDWIVKEISNPIELAKDGRLTFTLFELFTVEYGTRAASTSNNNPELVADIKIADEDFDLL